MHIKTVCYEISQRNPSCVIFLETGGETLGKQIADELQIPILGLNIRYPISRCMQKHRMWAPLLWLVKEIIYKFSHPTFVPPLSSSATYWPPVVLVDDSVSSGKTLRQALSFLNRNRIARNDVMVVTKRCGKRSRDLVDYVVSTQL